MENKEFFENNDLFRGIRHDILFDTSYMVAQLCSLFS